MSPEQVNKRGYNEKSDIWALGCILYEMAMLAPPFTAANEEKLGIKINECHVKRLSSQYSDDLNTVIRLLLEKDYNLRPAIGTILTHPIVEAHTSSVHAAASTPHSTSTPLRPTTPAVVAPPAMPYQTAKTTSSPTPTLQLTYNAHTVTNANTPPMHAGKENLPPRRKKTATSFAHRETVQGGLRQDVGSSAAAAAAVTPTWESPAPAGLEQQDVSTTNHRGARTSYTAPPWNAVDGTGLTRNDGDLPSPRMHLQAASTTDALHAIEVREARVYTHERSLELRARELDARAGKLEEMEKRLKQRELVLDIRASKTLGSPAPEQYQPITPPTATTTMSSYQPHKILQTPTYSTTPSYAMYKAPTYHNVQSPTDSTRQPQQQQQQQHQYHGRAPPPAPSFANRGAPSTEALGGYRYQPMTNHSQQYLQFQHANAGETTFG